MELRGPFSPGSVDPPPAGPRLLVFFGLCGLGIFFNQGWVVKFPKGCHLTHLPRLWALCAGLGVHPPASRQP
jgi:hypothetical protein